MQSQQSHRTKNINLTDIKNTISSKKTVIKVSATWCKPCNNPSFLVKYQTMKNKLNKVSFFELEISEHEEIIEELGLNISSVPTFLVYQSGVQIGIYEGTQCLSEIEVLLS